MAGLTDVFEEFKRNKKTLESIHNDTLECFRRIESSLAEKKHRELVQEMLLTLAAAAQNPDGNEDDFQVLGASNEENNAAPILTESLYTEKEQMDVSRLFNQTPSLIVVGQTNCGKSSLINEFLGVKVVSTKDQPCTARIVRLTYSEEPYARLVRPDGTQLERVSIPNNKVPRDLIDLQDEDRENEQRVAALVEAGLKIDFLKSGVDIIDSPGRNENPVLDQLVREQLGSILPFIIYVIDGHNLFTSLDKQVIKEILDERQDLDIFFVVSKIEPARADSSDESDESDESDDEEDGDDDDTRKESVQESKKRRVYQKLVREDFLIPNEKDMNTHENFHGLSAWRINAYNKKKKADPNWNDPDGEYTEYMSAFSRFQTCLQSFSESNLKANVERSSHILISVLSRCLNFFIQKANVLRERKKETVHMIKRIKVEEETIHENVLVQIEHQRSEIIDVMSKAISEIKEGVLEEARKLQYCELAFEVPPDGIVDGPKAINECRTQIRQMVVNKICESMRGTLMAMFARRDEYLLNLKERIQAIEKEAFPDGRRSTADVSIHLTLVSCIQVSANPQKFWTTNKIFRSFKEFLKKLFKRPMDAIRGKVNVGDSKWKEKQALESFEATDVPHVVGQLIKTMQDRFRECHEMFDEELDKVMHVFNQGITLKDDQRKAILKFVPDVSSLEMLCHSVKDRLKYGRPKKGEMIGSGAQGNVYECENISTPEGKPCVVKVVPVPNESTLKDLTLELHTTRNLSHPNILPLVCTIIEPNLFSGITVSLVSERMTSDLVHALPKLPSMRMRLQILLDVAEALKYLHEQGLLHRDVKMQNVLVDDNNRARLTDMGLCKPKGIMEHSLVGTPINMAPEMIKQKYDESVDVYAFGILIWRVCEGKGAQPKNIFLHSMPIIMLAVNAMEERKPEKLDTFSEPYWALMESCWSTVPLLRPKFDDIVICLNEFLKDPSIQ